MEFRCRLGTASGEIQEGVYAADTESQLRSEFDEKGLFVLSLKRRNEFSLKNLTEPVSYTHLTLPTIYSV